VAIPMPRRAVQWPGVAGGRRPRGVRRLIACAPRPGVERVYRRPGRRRRVKRRHDSGHDCP
jgi:hypothetical protein